MTRSDSKNSPWFAILALLFSLIVKLPIAPNFYPYPGRDSGVFAYIGWRILEGELPYVNVWDHKPPLVFYINALGLKMTNLSFWGVWIIGVISLAIAAYFSLKLLSKIYQPSIAIAVTAIWMGCLPTFYGNGNLTTEYTLPLQFASLYAVYFWLGDVKRPFWKFFLIGVLGGMAFMTKQSSIGVWVAIGMALVALLFHKPARKDTTKKILGMVAGVFFFCALVVLYFYLEDGLKAFLNQAFAYNFKYISRSNVSVVRRLMNLIDMREMKTITVFHLGVVGGFAALAHVLGNKKGKAFAPETLFYGLVVFNLVLEVLLTHLPDDTYKHYYMTMLPSLSILTGFLASSLIESLNRDLAGNRKWLEKAFLCMMAAFACIPLLWKWYDSLHGVTPTVNEGVIEFVQSETEPEDTILIWGAETMINYYTQREAPTRYVYQYPLIHGDYVNKEMILEFLNDIQEKEPKFIIDSNRHDMPFMTFPFSNEDIEEGINWITEEYELVEEIEGWIVYQKK